MSASGPPRPPTPSAPPTEVLGASEQPPTTRKWWQHGWGAAVIGAVGLLVGAGAGIGAAGSSSTKTVTAEGRPTTVQAAPTPAHTVTQVVVHTHTVTQTRTVAPSEASSSSSSSAGSYSGNGTKNIGTITVSQPSVLHWTAPEGFSITGEATPDEHPIAVASKASSGESVVEPGTYHDVSVIAVGEWSFTITPQG